MQHVGLANVNAQALVGSTDASTKAITAAIGSVVSEMKSSSQSAAAATGFALPSWYSVSFTVTLVLTLANPTLARSLRVRAACVCVHVRVCADTFVHISVPASGTSG